MSIGDAAGAAMARDSAIGVIDAVATLWVCWVTEPKAPLEVPQRSHESKVVRGTYVQPDHRDGSGHRA